MNNTLQNTLETKLQNHQAVIGIVGLGYVGLPLAIRYCDVGYRVVGFDINDDKVAKLNAGESYIGYITDDTIKKIGDDGFEATSDFSRIEEVDAILICVPTPLNSYREPDLSFVTGTVEAIAPYFRAGQVISLESTSYPGTTEEEILPRVEREGLTVGTDVFVVYSPEREDPGNINFGIRNIPRLRTHCLI